MKFFFLFCALILINTIASAQWVTGPNNDNPTYFFIDNGQGFGRSLTTATDANGNIFTGVFTTQFGGDIAIQKIDSNGFFLWGLNGIAITSATSNAQSSPFIIADDSGGCYVAYDDNDFFNGAFIQHYNSAGVPQYPGNGKLILASNNQTFGDISMVKQDNYLFITLTGSVFTDQQVYAQKMDLNLDYVWNSNGVALSAPGVVELSPYSISDGMGGIVTIYNRYYSLYNYQVRVQRTDSAGNKLWGAAGKLLNSSNLIYEPSMKIVADENQKYFAVWDGGTVTASNIYAQKIDTAGNLLWGTSELKVCDTVYAQNYPDIVCDKNGGAYIVWSDRRTQFNDFCMGQHLDSTGQKQWSLQGLKIDTNAYYNNVFPKLFLNSLGLNVYWSCNSGARIYKQILDSAGVALCTSIGVPITAPGNYSFNAENLIPLNNGDLVVACCDVFSAMYLKYVPDGCSFTSVFVNENIDNNSVSIFPNPAHNQIYLSPSTFENNQLIKIFNPIGVLVFEERISGNHINLPQLNAGLYTVCIESKKGLITKKILIQ